MERTSPAVAAVCPKQSWPPQYLFTPAPTASPLDSTSASSSTASSLRFPPATALPLQSPFAPPPIYNHQRFHQLPWELTHCFDHAPQLHAAYPIHQHQHYQQHQYQYLPPQHPPPLPERTLPQPFNFDFSFSLENAPTMPSSMPAVANANVIDLTLDDSPPRSVPSPLRRQRNSPHLPSHSHSQSRSGRSQHLPPRWPPSEVIDLDALPDEVPVRRPHPAPPASRPRPPTAGSDDIEVTLERPASTPLRHIPAGNFRLQPLEPLRMYQTADFESDNRPPALADARRESLARMGLPNFGVLGFARDFMIRQDNAELVLGFIRPPSSTPARRTQPRAPTEDDVVVISSKQETPVPPCREGFTRSPKEDDLLVCPNCDDELSVGDHPEKKQIWMVRACGHIYCGECTLNRFKAPQQKKNRPHPPKVHRPFAECRVDGCTSTTKAAKSMVRIRF